MIGKVLMVGQYDVDKLIDSKVLVHGYCCAPEIGDDICSKLLKKVINLLLIIIRITHYSHPSMILGCCSK